MHKQVEKLSTLIFMGLFIVPIMLFVVTLASYGTVYETNDIADYGKIKGNFNNEEPMSFIFSFFPDELHTSFSNVTYHYKAKKGDEFAYECYLEFVIEDTATYKDFLENVTDIDQSTVFQYDSTFMEYTVSNIMDIDWTSPNEEHGYPICNAEVGKILYCSDEQRVIFFALGMWDGGGTDTSELDYFFNKFNIDVIEYQLGAYYCDVDQENGITYKNRYELGMETPYPYPG